MGNKPSKKHYTTPANMHYYYNVSYFDELKNCKSIEAIKRIDVSVENKAIVHYEYDSGANSQLTELEAIAGDSLFTLSTIYPGLLIGTGYAHDVKAKNGLKVGFSFDYVTGLPIIPGSSIKGVLRSYFPENKKDNYNELKTLIREITDKDNLDFKYLIEDIFNYNDVFLGAYPVIEKNNNNILATDYITPHKNPIKNPIPISMLKVKPDVKYEFLFILHDSDKEKGGLTKEEKLELFKQLILLGGVGAKTNVGFGQFRE